MTIDYRSRSRVELRGSPRPRGVSRRPRRASAGGTNILVVDSHAPSVKLLEALEENGGIVRFARSAEEALQWIAVEKPALALIELLLPQMSGLLLANRLKTNQATRDIVLIAMTDLGGSATERLARSAGFAAYVRKPLDPSMLCGIVQAVGGQGAVQ